MAKFFTSLYCVATIWLSSTYMGLYKIIVEMIKLATLSKNIARCFVYSNTMLKIFINPNTFAIKIEYFPS